MLAIILAAFPVVLNQAVQISCDKGKGWGIPMDGKILTALHLVESKEPIYWTSPSGSGEAKIMGLDGANDVAILEVTTGKLVGTFRMATKRPEIQDEILWRCYLLAGMKPTVVRGWYLGQDSDDDMNIDGFISYGCSGSPIVNMAGEVLGMVQFGMNPAFPALKEGDKQKAMHFRALAFGKMLVK